MYDVSDYDFILPKKLIAQKPLSKRDSSRLLTIERQNQTINISKFFEIERFFKKGDILVLNETKVIPARIFGKSERNSSIIEMLLLKEIEENVWEVMVKPGKKIRINDKILLEKGVCCLIRGVTSYGNRIAVFDCKDNFFDYIEKFGKIPLPPYIERQDNLVDKKRYQTVYAKVPGAVAAPTAGLHFTKKLLGTLTAKGVIIVKIVLHVGAGTFRPIKSKSILDHKIHNEFFEVPKCSADLINKAKENGNKIFAAGTTVVRTLETVSDKNGFIKADKGDTDIFIYPGYNFKAVDHIITNFHLPKSTLILLISAFSSTELIKKAYETAIEKKFRFYSYGDAMLIL
ncbi:MAG: tRNA preQ1(34) S-adenosylmethionine ribosyltransferase-isomerase QueA [Candidatus Delongbacteria bacterium]|nr:tRNA preQ1(34) S-adenosylmethionine ribosyltransferase-isomerase QueA [Candidatus Delongbacteria bacterium]